MKRRDFLKALGITAGAFALPTGTPWPKARPLPIQGDTASTVIAGLNTETFTFWRNRDPNAPLDDLIQPSMVPHELAAKIAEETAEPTAEYWLNQSMWGLSDLTISGPTWNRDQNENAYTLLANHTPLWSWSPSRHNWAEGHELLFPAGAALRMSPTPWAWTAVVRRGEGDFVLYSDNTAPGFIQCRNPNAPTELLSREDELAWRRGKDSGYFPGLSALIPPKKERS